MKIKSINSCNLRNHEHFQFYTEVKDLLNAETPAKLKIELLFAAYEQAYVNEDTAFQKIMKSATTEEIEFADKTRDYTFRGLVDTNKAATKHFDTEVVAAAKRLKIVFDTYGNLSAKPLNEETSAIFNLLQELTGAYAADTQKVGLAAWVAQLETENNAFEALVKNRNDENAARTELKMKETRVELDAVYAQIVERINAFIVVEGKANYEPFVRKLNSFIEKYKNTIAQRKGIAKAKKQ